MAQLAPVAEDSFSEDARFYPEEFAEIYRRDGYWTSETFANLLDESAKKWPNSEAIVGRNYAGEEVRWTFASVRDRAEHFSTVLSKLGVRPRDRVLIHLPNIADYVPVVMGVFRMGAIPIFSIPAHRENALISFIDVATPVAVVTVEKYAGYSHYDLLQRCVQETVVKPKIVVLDEKNSPDAVAPAQLEPVKVHPECMAFIQVSGGTTGIPKLIPRTHAAYHYTIRESDQICGVNTHTRMLVVLPAAHNFTMSSPGILGVLYAGGTVIMCPDPVPSTAFKTIEEEQITMVSLVPPLLMSWLASKARSTRDISSLEVIHIGGASCPTEAARRVSPELGCKIQQVFGMAEGLVNYTRFDDPEELQVSTQGLRISPADEIKVLDEDGKPVTPGTPGILWTRGPYTIRGYLGGASPESFDEEGFYCPGDMVKILPSGHIVVTGRIKDHINRAGEKISAEEIENLLIGITGVIDAAVVGVPDSRLGERICAFIITENPQGLKHGAIASYLRARKLESHKIPDQTVVTDSFPVTGVGKLSRKDLRKALLKFVESENEEALKNE